MSTSTGTRYLKKVGNRWQFAAKPNPKRKKRNPKFSAGKARLARGVKKLSVAGGRKRTPAQKAAATRKRRRRVAAAGYAKPRRRVAKRVAVTRRRRITKRAARPKRRSTVAKK